MTTTDAPQTYTNGSRFEGDALVHLINTAYAAGRKLTVNGREVKAPHWTNRPADIWQNGSVEVYTVPRSKGARSSSIWVKVGQSATVTVA